MDVIAIVGPTGVGMFMRGFLFAVLVVGGYLVIRAALVAV
jgi:hypothetical protein